ncbi:DUF1203 domain-containing protein [Methylobacterium sp. Gmos1]
MAAFRCIPIPTETADRFRRTGTDDRGNPLRRIVATQDGAFPCRHCLRLAGPGETMLLGSYDLPKPLGIYWTPSPIFLHEAECPRAEAVDEVAPIVRENPLVSVRAYDDRHQCLYDLGHVGAGAEVDAPLARALDDPRTAFVNIHTARPGCLLVQVEHRPVAEDAGRG